jgi:hypothetical protein
MATKFADRRVLKLLACEIVWQEEVFRIPTGYDQAGKPPRYRIVLRNDEKSIACKRLEDIVRAITTLNFPMVAFFERYPSEIASMIARFLYLPRPVENHEFFERIEIKYWDRLSDVEPKLVDRELRWFEYPLGNSRELKERRLSIDSFTFVTD